MPPIVALSTWAYRRLLRAYPAAFRRRHGAEMAQVFRDLCRDAHRHGGTAGVLRLWLAALGDLAAGALGESLAAADGRRTGGAAVRYGMLAGIVVALGQVAYGLAVLHGRAGLDASSLAGGVLIGLELLLYGVAAVRIAVPRPLPQPHRATLCGLGGALWLVYTALADLVALDAAAYHLLAWGTIGGLCALYAAAGVWDARRSGTWAGGVGGGVWASLVAQLSGVITLFIVQYTFAGVTAQVSLADPGYLRSGLHDVATWNIQDALGGAFCTLLLAPLCGALFGGAGALFGKGQAGRQR